MPFLNNFAGQRARMVEEQLCARGISDEALLRAMGGVPRERFVPTDMRAYAYDDGPLPIGEGQTISQPWVVAKMIQLLEVKPEHRVLEIGTGSGYSAAVLSYLVAEVFSIERLHDLAVTARERLADIGIGNVTVIEGDGSQGYPEAAPYDAIVVTAGSPEVPEPLKEQLAIGGRLVIPVGDTRFLQRLLRIRRRSGQEFDSEALDPVRFVPLIGEDGWEEK